MKYTSLPLLITSLQVIAMLAVLEMCGASKEQAHQISSNSSASSIT